ncbi:hypothetical protein [Streptomyces sp. NPDC006739]|uniref:hypothetical protein n=1 Tax=Streptomyces sp. NPDC006739 TaxID=3364763 RepID=UPI00368B416F
MSTTPTLRPGTDFGVSGPFPLAPLSHPLDRRWLHYAFLSRQGGQAVIANLSVLGASRGVAFGEPGAAGEGGAESRTGPRPQRTAILLVHQEGRGWSSSRFDAEQPAAPWSAFRLPRPRPQGGTGPPDGFRVAGRGVGPLADLRLRRTGRPSVSQCASFGDGEHLRRQCEPGVLATGTVRWSREDTDGTGAGRPTELIGCHERVRGRWSWPALGGWVSGFAHDPAGDPCGPPPSAVVFTLVQPSRTGRAADAANGSVMLWRDGRPVRHFPRRGLRVTVRDTLPRDRVTLVPPLAGLLGAAPAAAVPRRLLVTARMGEDRLVIDFLARTAARVAGPSETGVNPFSVHETLGEYVVEARVSGRRTSFCAMGLVEFAGGAGDG